MSDKAEYGKYLCDPQSIAAVRSATDLPTERARNGQPTLTYRGLRLHSSVDPVSEANSAIEEIAEELRRRLSEPESTVTCVVLGPGLGYVVGALSRYAEQTGVVSRIRILCVESDAEVARKALHLRLWEPCEISVCWFVGPAAREELKTRMDHGPRVYIAHPTGYRLNKKFYDELMTDLQERAVPERPLRILIPSPLYGGSYPIALHCADAFRALGHQVELLDFSAYYPFFSGATQLTRDVRHQRTLQSLLTTYLAETVAARAIDWKADLVWAVAQSPLTPTALEELRRDRIHSALWFVEDYTVFGYWRQLAPHLDAVFTIQKGEFHNQLRAAGTSLVDYLPCAANPAVHRPLDLRTEERLRYGAEVAFVGAGYHNRQNLFTRLRLPGFKVWGNDWPPESHAACHVQEDGRRVSAEETALIYNATTINLNLHSSPHHPEINPHGDYVNPRTFEIAACGAFQLTDIRQNLAELFGESDLAVFKRPDDIPRLVGYYLHHETERAGMAAQARDRVLKEHTYEHRMTAAIALLEKNLPRLAERKRGPNYVSSLKRAVADDAELMEFLSSFEDDQEVTLDDIVGRINVGKGELTRAEGLFLLMKEFRDWGREKGVIQ
ncbi:glycosyltransferase [bacterium]|nr:glycosyltransferase [bacterium]MBU1983783.1 glycosyltransferase [bacterium]